MPTNGGDPVTPGWLLNGRVRHDQPATGFRSGIEPVLLAASVPARAGDRVIEGGSGAGAALLCLSARVPGVFGVGVELCPAMAAVARTNGQANAAPLCFVAGDVTRLPIPSGWAGHALANPPYHDGAAGPASPDIGRYRAKTADPPLMSRWIAGLAAALRHRGTLTLCIPAAQVPTCMSASTDAGMGSFTLFPLWPRKDATAKLVLLRTVRGGRASFTIAAGLVLHEAHGPFTPEADAILRNGAALPLD